MGVTRMPAGGTGAGNAVARRHRLLRPVVRRAKRQPLPFSLPKGAIIAV
jgi:hypothetical protein